MDFILNKQASFFVSFTCKPNRWFILKCNFHHFKVYNEMFYVQAQHIVSQLSFISNRFLKSLSYVICKWSALIMLLISHTHTPITVALSWKKIATWDSVSYPRWTIEQFARRSQRSNPDLLSHSCPCVCKVSCTHTLHVAVPWAIPLNPMWHMSRHIMLPGLI